MRLALQAGADVPGIHARWHQLASVPFTYTRKRSSTLVYEEGERWKMSRGHHYFKECVARARRKKGGGIPTLPMTGCRRSADASWSP